MNGNYSERMLTVLEYVNDEAIRLGDETVGVEHLILGMIREGEGSAVKTLNVLGLEMPDLRAIIEEVISINEKKTLNFNSTNRNISKQAKNILEKSNLELHATNEKEIKTIHILLSILRDKNNIIFSILNKLRIEYKNVLEGYKSIQNKYDDGEQDDESTNDDDLFEDMDTILNGKAENFDPLNDEKIILNETQIAEMRDLFDELPIALDIILYTSKFEPGHYKSKWYDRNWIKTQTKPNLL